MKIQNPVIEDNAEEILLTRNKRKKNKKKSQNIYDPINDHD